MIIEVHPKSQAKTFGVYFSFGDEPIEKREDYEVTDVRWLTKGKYQLNSETLNI